MNPLNRCVIVISSTGIAANYFAVTMYKGPKSGACALLYPSLLLYTFGLVGVLFAQLLSVRNIFTMFMSGCFVVFAGLTLIGVLAGVNGTACPFNGLVKYTIFETCFLWGVLCVFLIEFVLTRLRKRRKFAALKRSKLAYIELDQARNDVP